MKKLLYILCQCSWGVVQTLVGAVMFLLFASKPHRMYHGAVVTVWNAKGSISLGMFVFLSDRHGEALGERVLLHEFGHTIQSLILGPFYLLVIGLPSVIWAGMPPLARLRSRRGISYYRMYTERWANHLGQRYIGGDVPE